MVDIGMVRLVGGGEFDSVSDEDIERWDEFVTPMVSKKFFGKMYDQAKILLICHKMALNGVGNNGLGEFGKVKNSYTASSVSDGGTSISFSSVGAGNTGSNAEYGMTAYGTQYLQLVRACNCSVHISGEENIHVLP